MKREEGFTLIELAVVIVLVGVLVTLGATATRYFWLTRSLDGSRHEVSAQLRALQQQVMSESNPIVLGAWFRAGVTSSSTQWGLVRADPGDFDWSTTGNNSCVSIGARKFKGGVQVGGANFVDKLALQGIPKSTIVGLCKAQVGAAANATDFVLFFPRGTATSGCVRLTQPRLDKPDLYVRVGALTGRVDEITSNEVSTCP